MCGRVKNHKALTVIPWSWYFFWDINTKDNRWNDTKFGEVMVCYDKGFVWSNRNSSTPFCRGYWTVWLSHLNFMFVIYTEKMAVFSHKNCIFSHIPKQFEINNAWRYNCVIVSKPEIGCGIVSINMKMPPLSLLNLKFHFETSCIMNWRSGWGDFGPKLETQPFLRWNWSPYGAWTC